MVHRDPETGLFVSDDDEFDDIEMVTFAGSVGVEASNLAGNTGFSGGANESFEAVEVIDYDDVVDRNEEVHLLSARHRATAFSNSTQTADGTVVAGIEISSSPALSEIAKEVFPRTDSTAPSGEPVVGRANKDDTIDIIGRVMQPVGHSPFSDGSSGAGGGGSAGEDIVDIEDGLPMEAGRFHPRDELFCNGRIITWNIDDAGVHVNFSGQHVYGVVED
jgi:hypothetical protein